MKRLFPTGLTFVLVVGSLGNVLAAAFCPRMGGSDCCLTKMAGAPHNTQSHQHMHDMSMDSMADENTSINGSDMPGMATNDAEVPVGALASDEVLMVSTSPELAPANKVDLPSGACTHCASHSGIQNAPVSSLSAPDLSSKNTVAIPLPASRFLAQPAMTPAQIGLPREHAPPGTSAPRYILISVFLI